MDRTDWKFGATDINILVLAIVYKGVAFPLLFRMMPKFGNSSTQGRIDLMDHFIRLFGVESIECLLADREFIGQHWLAYLNHLGISYHIRIIENFWVDIPHNGNQVKAFWIFKHLRNNQHAFYRQIVRIKGQQFHLSASKVRNKKGEAEFQIIVSYSKPEEANPFYRERWQLKYDFKALKSSGFNIEKLT